MPGRKRKSNRNSHTPQPADNDVAALAGSGTPVAGFDLGWASDNQRQAYEHLEYAYDAYQALLAKIRSTASVRLSGANAKTLDVTGRVRKAAESLISDAQEGYNALADAIAVAAASTVAAAYETAAPVFSIAESAITAATPVAPPMVPQVGMGMVAATAGESILPDSRLSSGGYSPPAPQQPPIGTVGATAGTPAAYGQQLPGVPLPPGAIEFDPCRTLGIGCNVGVAGGGGGGGAGGMPGGIPPIPIPGAAPVGSGVGSPRGDAGAAPILGADGKPAQPQDNQELRERQAERQRQADESRAEAERLRRERGRGGRVVFNEQTGLWEFVEDDPQPPQRKVIGNLPPQSCPPCERTRCTYNYKTDQCRPGAIVPIVGPDDDTGEDRPTLRATDDGIPLREQWRSHYRLSTCSCYLLPPGAAEAPPEDMLLFAGTAESCVVDETAKCFPLSDRPGGQSPPEETDSSTAASPSEVPQTGQCADIDNILAGTTVKPGQSISEALGLTDRNNRVKRVDLVGSPAWLDAIYNGGKEILATIANGMQAAAKSAGGKDCEANELWQLSAFGSAFYNLTSWLLGTVGGDARDTFDYVRRFACPSGMPTDSDAIQAFLTDSIDLSRAECWARMNNAKVEPWSKRLDSARSRHTWTEQVALLFRGVITDEQFDKRIRELGFINADDARDARELGKAIPPITDITRFMVRDTDDQNIVNRFGLDAQFEDKFGGKLREWAKNQGIDETYARYFWRAHWSIPSPTQLYEIYHRQRHDGRFGGDARVRDEVRTALVQQDILPFWVDRLMEMSFRPLTRVDARRAYKIGAISRQELLNAHYAIGYDDKNAETLTQFTERDTIAVWARSRAAQDHAAGFSSRQDMERELVGGPMADQVYDQVYNIAAARVRAAMRKNCAKAIRKRYLAGELTDNEATNELTGLGIELGRAAENVMTWKCERAARGKELSAATLCRLVSRGIITALMMEDRLVRIGYSDFEARAMVNDCIAANEERKERQRKQREREEKARAKSDQAATDAAGKKAAARDARARKALAAAQRAREKRQDALVKAAEKWAEIAGVPLSEAIRQLNTIYKIVGKDAQAEIDDAIQAVTRAVARATAGDIDQLAQAATAIAIAENELSPPLDVAAEV